MGKPATKKDSKKAGKEKPSERKKERAKRKNLNHGTAVDLEAAQKLLNKEINEAKGARKGDVVLPGDKKLLRKQQEKEQAAKSEAVASKTQKKTFEKKRPREGENGGKASGHDDKRPKTGPMTKKERKEKKKERRGSKKHGEVVNQVVELWEKARRNKFDNDVTKEDRDGAVKDIWKLTQGMVYDICMKHEAVRCVQTCVHYGGSEIRASIYKELKGKFVDLVKDKYARFLVKKFLKYGTVEQKKGILVEFHKKVVHLLRHKEASPIIEFAYSQAASPQSQKRMLSEFYGPEFALFEDKESKSLHQVLEKTPGKADVIRRHMLEVLIPMLGKGFLTHTIVQRGLVEYLSLLAEPEAVKEIIQYVQEGSEFICTEKYGAQIVIRCLDAGDAKDRKKIIKSMKGYIPRIAATPYGFTVLCRAVDVVDDTVLVFKSLIQEYLADENAVLDKYGKLVLLYLLCHRKPKYFPPSVLENMPEVISGEGVEGSICKKDTTDKRKGLLTSCLKQLCEVLQTKLETLLQSQEASSILIEFMDCDEDLGITSAAKTDLLNKVLSLVEDSNDREESLLNHAVGHRVLKHMVKSDAAKEMEFPKELLSRCAIQLKEAVSEGERGSWVLVAMLEAEPSIKSKMSKLVGGLLKKDSGSPGNKVLKERLSE